MLCVAMIGHICMLDSQLNHHSEWAGLLRRRCAVRMTARLKMVFPQMSVRLRMKLPCSCMLAVGPNIFLIQNCAGGDVRQSVCGCVHDDFLCVCSAAPSPDVTLWTRLEMDTVLAGISADQWHNAVCMTPCAQA